MRPSRFPAETLVKLLHRRPQGYRAPELAEELGVAVKEGKPLDSYETLLQYIRTTKTKTGLKVKATLIEREYETGLKPDAAGVAAINLRRHQSLPAWNYIVAPRA
jgi:hypothetical protein